MTWADDDTPAAPRRYATVVEFVTEWLGPRYARPVDTSTSVAWCRRWTEHPEAVSRLTALWYAWEKLGQRDDGTQLATWWLVYADPMMAALLDPDGPFKACGRGHSERIAPLQTDPSAD